MGIEMEKPLHVRVAEALGAIVSFRYDEWRALREDAPKFIGPLDQIDDVTYVIPHYDTDWSATGPLIEKLREEGWLVGVKSDGGGEWLAWKDDIDQYRSDRPRQSHRGRGPTPLIAVCNLILELGKEGKLERKD